MSSLPKLSNPLFIWENLARSGTVFGVGNIIIFSVMMDFPIFMYIMTWGGLALMSMGLFAKITRTSEKFNKMEHLVAKSACETCVTSLYNGLDQAMNYCAPIIFWDNIQNSVIAFAAIYVCSSLFAVFSVSLMAFALFNTLFIYGKFQDVIVPLAEPHVKVVGELATKYWAMIPRYQPPTPKKDE